MSVTEERRWSPAYAGLSHINDVRPRDETDDKIFARCAKVLHDAGLEEGDEFKYLNRFGLCLLHWHFPVYLGEVISEATNEVKRIQTMVPENVDAHPDEKSVETSWRLTKSMAELVGEYPLQTSAWCRTDCSVDGDAHRASHRSLEVALTRCFTQHGPPPPAKE